MDGGGGLNAASDQNAHCRCEPERRVRLSGLSLRTGLSLATTEKHRQVSRNDPGENAPVKSATDAGDCGGCESELARLVRIFSSQHQERVCEARPVCAATSTDDGT